MTGKTVPRKHGAFFWAVTIIFIGTASVFGLTYFFYYPVSVTYDFTDCTILPFFSDGEARYTSTADSKSLSYVLFGVGYHHRQGVAWTYTELIVFGYNDVPTQCEEWEEKVQREFQEFKERVEKSND